MDSLELLQELVSAPGPSGQEEAVRLVIAGHLDQIGRKSRVDAKGNLIVDLGEGPPRIVVTAHMDEIAMVVRQIEGDEIVVGPLGGLYPWKLGEGPVSILPLGDGEPINGVLSFGGIHTGDESSTVELAEKGAVSWEMARVLTGLPFEELVERGVRPGSRVVVSPARRKLTQLGDLIAGYFLDDRADLVSWLLALAELGSDFKGSVSFVATAAEEVGGEGALYYLHEHRPEVCIALELGPNVPDAQVEIGPDPTLWVTDSYATMAAADIASVEDVAREAGIGLQFQALSRGGSDASCAASHGLCARPITLGLPMENSHGYEIIDPESMDELARLTAALVRHLA